MLRIILLLLLLYIVFRIAVRLLLTESPSQKRSRIYGQDGYGYRSGKADRRGENHQSRRGRFDHIEDAEFEEIPDDSSEEK